MTSSNSLFKLTFMPIAVLSVIWLQPALAGPTLVTQSFNIDENTASNTLIGQVTASGGAATRTLQLDVGSQNVSNWMIRGEDYEPVRFNTSFNTAPIVLTQIQSKGNYTVIYSVDQYDYTGQTSKKGYEVLFLPRQQNTTTSGFEAILETDIKIGGNSVVTSIDNVGGSENLGWLAISDAAQGVWDGLPFEAALTGESMTHSTSTVSFTGPFDNAPQVKTSIATSNENNRTGVGITHLNSSAIKLFMDEIDDGDHTGEAVSLLMLQGSGSLTDVQGNVMGETGQLSFKDDDRDSASTVALLNTYTNPVVFVQPLETGDDMQDAGFRFTNIGSNSFSGYLQDDDEYRAYGAWGTFDLHYFVFEAGTWQVGIENYNYSIIAGNDSGAFSIDAGTGEIKIADSSQLDYESGITQYNLTVQVTDGSGATGHTGVTIDINNVSDSLNADAQAIQGLAANDWSGWQTAAAGDINGDGFDDVIIGAPKDDTNGTDAGAAYVLFGNSSGTLSSFSDVIAGHGGFVIYGAAANDQAGRAVGGGADINGDGLADIAIGSPFSGDNGTSSGKAYVVFGKSDTRAVQLSDIALDSNSGGFVMKGSSSYDWSGGSFVFGDVNGDGLADIVVGEQLRTDNSGGSLSFSNRNNKNWAYVVYGKTDGHALELSDIADDNNEQGFVIASSSRSMLAGWKWGSFVMSAGDFNTDGLTDFVLNRNLYNSKQNYMIFGRIGGHAVTIDSNTVSGADSLLLKKESGSYGLSISSGNSYMNSLPSFQTSAVGDINADGIDDLALLLTDVDCCDTITQARAYIVFGGNTSNDIELSDIAAGNGGFAIHNDVSDNSAVNIVLGSISGAGDINGDGYDDVMIGDPHAADGNGGIYVVYGKSGTGAIHLSTVASGENGFHSTGNAGDRLGDWLSRAGDINGDGISDMLFAAPTADPNDLGNAGTVYVMLGKGDAITVWGTDGADSLNGDTGDNIAAGQGDDSIIVNGASVIYAGPGDDTITINSSDFTRINGGRGTDTLKVEGANVTLTLSAASARVRDIEMIDITGTGANVLSFNKNISGSNRVIVKGDADDTVYSTNQQWVDSGNTETLDGVTYAIYSVGSAEFWLQSGLSLTTNADPVISAQSFSVDEYTEGGTVLGTLTADASDIGDSLSFSVLSGNEAGYFSINAGSGELAIADSVNRLDYESGAHYDLTVQVTDVFGATASAIITIDVNDLSAVSREFTLDASGGGSIWGGWGSLNNLLGRELTAGADLVWELGEIPGVPIDTPVMDLSMEGTFRVGSSYTFEGGTIEANLPVTLSLEYPDEVQPGSRVKLTTSVAFDNSAGFDVDSTAFYVEAHASLEDYNIQLGSELPALVSDINNFSGSISGDYDSYQQSIESSKGTASSTQSADNPLRLEAQINLPDWVDEAVGFSESWKGWALSLSGKKEKCVDGYFGPAGEDLYYKFEYTVAETYLWASADLYHDFSVELQPTGLMTLEDGSQYTFDLTEGLIFTPETSYDTNDDGIIDATLDVSLTPVFVNDTEMNASLYMPFTTAHVGYNIQEALCTDNNVYLYQQNGLVYAKDSKGPMIDAEVFSLNALDLLDTVTYSLSDVTYTEKLAFDLCDGTGTACAASANNAPSVSNVSVSGTVQVGNTLTASYIYSDTDGHTESGSTYQWRSADDEAGTNVSNVSGATSISYTLADSDSGHYLQFCVIPFDGESSGTQGCSGWQFVVGKLNPQLSAGFDKALMLNGVDQYGLIHTGGALNPASGSFTAETWFKVGNLDSSEQMILHQQAGSGTIGRVWLGVKSSGLIYTWLSGALYGTTVISPGVWHHAAVVYDQSSGTLSLYLDGVLESSETRTMESSDGDIVLGARKNVSSSFFGGALDETRIWNEARTQAQIQQNMGLSVASNESNLQLYYSYDHDTDSTVNDATDQYPATLNHTVSLANSTEHSLSFDGDGDYVWVDSYAGVTGTAARTVEAWVKTTAVKDAIISWGTNNGGKKWIVRTHDNGHLRVEVNGGYVIGDVNISDGVWHHIAVSFEDDGSPNVTDVLLYVDGALTGTSSSKSKTINTATDGTVNIGTDHHNRYWQGEMDEVRIWDDVRSQAEIQTAMHQRLTGLENNLVAYYSFEGGTASDLSGNGRDGVLIGNTTASYRGLSVFTRGSGDLDGVLPQGNGKQWALDSQPSLGSVILERDTGVFTYSPIDAGYIGFDTFNYHVLDGNGDYSHSETVYLDLESSGQ